MFLFAFKETGLERSKMRMSGGHPLAAGLDGGNTMIPSIRSAVPKEGIPQPGYSFFAFMHVGAIMDRPPKNVVFRIFRRKITAVSPYGD